MAKEKLSRSISFVISNPTFEIWFLLHFKFTTKTYLNGDMVIGDLKKYIPDYEKSKDVYSLCNDRISDALRNADKLEAYHAGKDWPSEDCNPRTDVAEIVRIFEG
ncbi:RloB-like protein [Butyrivibrio fibrisolvens DSM 3071]|uniref:RloB-like protein n=1 Tax=Butyrivibrio fibrisolvens DSM 3071 TaxID=1121131 RepID=A0A1M5XUD3_BUTFI|nr:RloB family protein [Butyrivibrio fibrisolvens]SHI02863.1 RloB-like protein [Butyrivibrio fibrisolvens DSM 3071]